LTPSAAFRPSLHENLVTDWGDADIEGLMDAVGCDESRSFEMLYDEHRLEVLAYCSRRVSAADAADACAETFLVAWRRIGDVPPAPRTLPYLYGIAAKVIANQRRTLHRRARLYANLGALGVAPPADPSVGWVERSHDSDVVAAVRRLKPTDREIVMLFAWEDLPRDVIAEMMGMTRAAIDQRIHRSYKRLARILKPVRTTSAPPIIQTGGT
jgi:RNA polymerase sigma-70 factor (ECF subfamily)